jgi:hypothetical protein
MALEAGEDIVERALLRLLAPKQAPISEMVAVKKKKFRGKKRPPCQPADETLKKKLLPARVSVVARLSSVTLRISWSDSTSGYFGEQVWRMGLAHVQSVCALSGMPIRIGDSIFRPWVSDARAPANGHRMILSSSVHMAYPRL